MAILLQKEFNTLKKQLMDMGARAEKGLHDALEAISKRDPEMAANVFKGEKEIDLREVLIEEECLKVLALHQPVATDLRFVVAVLKINKNIERIDDLSVNIADCAVTLSKMPELDIPLNFSEMGGKTQLMLRKSLDSLVNIDAHMAREVCTSDDEVDDLNREIYDVCRKAMKKNPEKIDTLLMMLAASRHLERIADHTTNIAKDVIYMIEGEIVRHRKDEYLLSDEDK